MDKLQGDLGIILLKSGCMSAVLVFSCQCNNQSQTPCSKTTGLIGEGVDGTVSCLSSLKGGTG